MSREGGNFFEEHIVKLVFAIVGVACIFVLISRVLISPNVVVYDDKRFGAGDIDDYISKKAEVLSDKLDSKVQSKPPYELRVDELIALIHTAARGVYTSLSLLQP